MTHVPALRSQRFVKQSAFVVQPASTIGHGRPQAMSPQSISLSSPFLTPSEQDGKAHNPLEQTPERQSDATAQTRPAEHAAHAPPPQSSLVSAPFTTKSKHVGAAQRPLLSHTPLAQSADAAQSLPVAHFLFEHEEPQSMSDSNPFLTPSSHVGMGPIS